MKKYDVIVCGAGPSGIVCALSASRLGSKVLLIEDSGLLGGTNVLSLVGPLMTFHNQNQKVISGMADEIISRLEKVQGTLGHINDPLGFCSTITPIDVEALKNVYFEMISESNIDLLLHTKIIGVVKDKQTITGIKIANVEGELIVEGKSIVDATGDAVVAKYADAQTFIGRSSDNLCQPMTMPFIVGNVDLETLREEMKKNPSNFVLDQNYDYNYVGISGFFKEVKKAYETGDFPIERDRVLLFQNVAKDQVTINMTRVSKLSALSAEELTKAEIEGRKQVQIVYRFLKKYIPGFENSVIIQTPYQIGIRESRHVVTDYIMTEQDIINHQTFDDSIAIGAFPMDIHNPTGKEISTIKTIKNSETKNLGYEIPMRSLLTKDFTNLIITGRSIGANHEAASSLRVTPIVYALGQAAGTIAHFSSKNHQNIHDVDYTLVQKELLKNHQIIKLNNN